MLNNGGLIICRGCERTTVRRLFLYVSIRNCKLCRVRTGLYKCGVSAQLEKTPSCRQSPAPNTGGTKLYSGTTPLTRGTNK